LLSRRLSPLLLAGALLALPAAAQKTKPTKAKEPVSAASPAEKAAAMRTYVDALLAKMTLDEKIGQLNLLTIGFDVTGPMVSKNVDENIRKGLVGGVFNTYTPNATRKLQELAVKQTRLGIPLILGYDVVHGHRTIFPAPLGLAASWDMAAVERSARVAAEESSADGLNWVYSPMVDIARDPRWGRVMEGAGEDPYLGALVAAAMVRGYQGNDLAANNAVMACVKHFALYGAAEAGREYNTTDMSRVRMYNEYLAPYKAAVDAGAGSLMSSFNEIDGIPATANRWLLDDLLRKQWGFKGFVVTDYASINEIPTHGYAASEAEAARQALAAGSDMDMVGETFLHHLGAAVKSGQLSEAQLTEACRRILEAKYKLGLFQDAYRGVTPERAAATMLKPEFRASARDIARKTMVLLKNERQTLPLKKSGTIALVGPLANRQRDLIGPWYAAGDWKQAVSLEQGLKNVAGSGVKVIYAKGANVIDDPQLIERLNRDNGLLDLDARSSEQLIAEAVKAAQQADVVVAAVGEAAGMSGEAASRSDIGLPGQQLELLKALKKTGKPLIIVLMNGRPLALPWEQANADAILETWLAGTEGGNAIADVLFGAYNPAGHLTMTFPQNVGQIPIYYNHKSTGRPYDGVAPDKYKSRYLDVVNDPLYPFGFGLSYTKFTYGKPQLSKASLRPGEGLDVTVTVQNTGSYDGEEVAQLYLRDVAASVTRPVKELKGYQKVMLKKGESRTLTFHLMPDDLKFYNHDLKLVAEPGEFRIFVGPNSRDVQELSFTLQN
jgi:beta-glucosidase